MKIVTVVLVPVDMLYNSHNICVTLFTFKMHFHK